MKKVNHAPSISNKRANFEYHLIKKYSAGIILTGTEVKAVREGKVNLQDGFCFLRKDELYCKGIHISEYKYGTVYNHQPFRERKLLLNKKEIEAIASKIKEKGVTVIPVMMSFSERGFVKLEIALAQGKKLFDKRATTKERELKKELNRMNKHKNY
jgi:SsrA-binding protein